MLQVVTQVKEQKFKLLGPALVKWRESIVFANERLQEV